VQKPARGSGFTLIEIMMVVGILGMVLAMGMPAFIQSIRKDPLRQAVSDLETACSKAREAAILRGSPVELVIRESGEVSVAAVPESEAESIAPGEEATAQPAVLHSGSPIFSGHLPVDSVGIAPFVNMKEAASEAHVHFYPNGTSDEFTVLLTDLHGSVRRISLECVTSLATVEVLR
jgi:type IV fimbrial biogenesis protein FimT